MSKTYSKRTLNIFFIITGLAVVGAAGGIAQGYNAYNNTAAHTHPTVSIDHSHTHEDFTAEQEKILDKHFGDWKVEAKEYIDGRLGVTGTPTPTPQPTPQPAPADVTISTNQDQYDPGDTMTVSGFGEKLRTTKIFLNHPDGTQRQIANTNTDADGRYIAVYVLPSSLAPGTYHVIVQVAVDSATQQIKITDGN